MSWYVPRGTKGQLNYKVWQSLNRIYFSFILLAEPLTDEGQALRQVSVHCLLVGCLSSQQHASVSQGRICTDNFTCCHTEIEGADQTFHLTQSQYTDTGPTSPSADPITPGAWQGSHWSANFEVTGKTRPRKNPGASGIRTRDRHNETLVFISRDFSGSSHTSDLKIGTPVATLSGAWHYRVSTGTGRPGVSILWLGEIDSLICNFYLSVAARKIVWADPSLRYTRMLLGR